MTFNIYKNINGWPITVLKIKLKDLLQDATQTDIHCWSSHIGVFSLTKKLNACHVQHTMEIKTLLEDKQLAQQTQETTKLLIIQV